MFDRPRVETGATALTWTGAVLAVVGATLRWEARTDVILPPGQYATGVEHGGALLTVPLALAALAVQHRAGWESAAVPVGAAGVALAGSSLVLPGSPGPLVTAVAGSALVLASAVAASRHATLTLVPRPFADAGLDERWLRLLAGTGAFLVFVPRAVGFATAQGSPSNDGYVALVLGVAAVALVATAVGWAWPVAALAVPTGAGTAVVSAHYLYTLATAVNRPATTTHPVEAGLAVYGGLALLAAGVLTLGGAGGGRATAPDREAVAATEGSAGGP